MRSLSVPSDVAQMVESVSRNLEGRKNGQVTAYDRGSTNSRFGEQAPKSADHLAL